MKNFWAWLLVIGFLIALFFYTNLTSSVPLVKIGEVKLKVELAQTPQAREQGLSGRAKLADGTGMLFIFDQPGMYKFWMKDMNFPIDMIWLAPSEGGDGGDLQIVYIKKDARPELYPETYGPYQNTKYVLEVNSGFSDKNNLKEGDKVEFNHILN